MEGSAALLDRHGVALQRLFGQYCNGPSTWALARRRMEQDQFLKVRLGGRASVASARITFAQAGGRRQSADPKESRAGRENKTKRRTKESRAGGAAEGGRPGAASSRRRSVTRGREPSAAVGRLFASV